MPPTRELARRLAISRNTVGVAYDRLAAEGFLTSRVGAGTFVRETGSAARGAPAVSPLRPRAVWEGCPPGLRRCPESGGTSVPGCPTCGCSRTRPGGGSCRGCCVRRGWPIPPRRPTRPGCPRCARPSPATWASRGRCGRAAPTSSSPPASSRPST
ncbi:GntR family transcriptional regulator [Actinomadura luteofluorescens]|uniref:GntR family transcriptional regulator n=1 Tax=Actinomadura luteofluorescens TaxID=46163 RepID=UPI00362D0F6D